MTSKEFVQLAKPQQRIYLLTQGNFLAERQNRQYDLMLYELHGFYAEVAFVKRTNKVAYFKTFEDTKGLDPYLAQISIDDLLQEALY